MSIALNQAETISLSLHFHKYDSSETDSESSICPTLVFNFLKYGLGFSLLV